MRQITDIKQLKKGDRIATLCEGKIKFLTYIQEHPYNSEYSLMMNADKDCEKFYNRLFGIDAYYYFSNSKEDWNDLYQLQIEWFERRINRIREQQKRLAIN